MLCKKGKRDGHSNMQGVLMDQFFQNHPGSAMTFHHIEVCVEATKITPLALLFFADHAVIA
jgi:hypothetical protein